MNKRGRSDCDQSVAQQKMAAKQPFDCGKRTGANNDEHDYGHRFTHIKACTDGKPEAKDSGSFIARFLIAPYTGHRENIFAASGP